MRLPYLALLTAVAAALVTPPTSRAQSISITVPPLVPATVGVGYVPVQFTASGGTAPYQWSISQGALPPGLTLDPATGTLGGIPVAPGTFNFSVSVLDASQASNSTSILSIVSSNPSGFGPITVPPLPNGAVNVAYPPSAFQVVGGTAPLTWSVAFGSLPPGMSLNPTTGVLSGTPTSVGEFTFVVDVMNSQEVTAGTPILSLLVFTAPAPIIVSAPALPNATAGAAYATAAFTATGGAPPYTWSVATGSLPPGLSIGSGTGVISGVPTTPGVFTFSVKATDITNGTGVTPSLTLTVNPAALAISAPALPPSPVGVAVTTAAFTASGGSPPYTFFLSAGGLPAGITIGAATGVLTGTPTKVGTYGFTIGVRDNNGTVATAPPSTWTITPALTIVAPTLLPATVNTPYSTAAFTASGGTAPYTWTLLSGSLPTGLSLGPTTGIISGTPTATGTSTFSVSVADTSGATGTAGPFSLTVNPGALTITAPVLPTAPAGVPIVPARFMASGGVPPYAFSVSTGALPPGITLDSPSGTLSGTPTTVGTYTFSVTVKDTASTIATAAPSVLNITNTFAIVVPVLPVATLDTAYTAPAFTAVGGTPPYTWAVVSGSLPPGLSLGPNTGVISGTPKQAGGFVFSIKVSDTAGATAVTTAGQTITVSPSSSSLSITVPALTPAPVGSPIVPIQFKATGGTPPYTFSIWTGSLPPGLTLDPKRGTLSGTPTTIGNYTFSVAVKDNAGILATTPVSILTVTTALTISVPPLPPAIVNTFYRTSPFSASGGGPPYTWSTSGSLPPGLTMNPNTGIISGTPTTLGSSSFSVTLLDGGGVSVTTSMLVLAVNPPLSIATPSLPEAFVGVPYPPVQFSATGGASPYTFAVSAGSLPTGITLNSGTGVLSGTPTSPGPSTFTIQVTDSEGTKVQTNSLSIHVTEGHPPQITTSTLPNAILGSAYNQQLTALGAGPFTWSILSGSLPPGITLDSGGLLSGTATDTGTFPFTVQVKDAVGLTSTAPLSLQSAFPALPAVTFAGLTSPADPAQQPTFTLSLASPFPVALSGVVTLTFQSSAVAPADDPAIQFVTGGRTAPFTIAAGQTSAVFSVPQMAFSTGTVAGTITLTATFKAGDTDVTPSPAPSHTVVINAAPPKITSVTIQSSGTGTAVVVSGFSTSRQVTGGSFTLSISGGSLASTTVTVDLNSVFGQWYQDPASAAFGSTFVYRQPFTISGPGSISSASVTLTNAQGTSQPVSSQ